MPETLRVTGRAVIVRDQNIGSAMMEGGRMPELALIVVVERTFFHCGKCITRSNLWGSGAHYQHAAALSPTAPAL